MTDSQGATGSLLGDTSSYPGLNGAAPVDPGWSPSYSHTQPGLQLAVQQSEALLNDFFAGAAWSDQLISIFGNAGTDSEKLAERISTLQANLLATDLLTGITLISSDSMGGALGAFSSAGPNGEAPRIFLNADWAAGSSVDAVTGVILEEYGHAIDYYLNQELDSPGDEGDLFSRSLRNIAVTEADMAGIIEESDHIYLTYQGTTWLAEAALTVGSSTTGTNVNTYVGRGDLIRFNTINIPSPSGAVLLNINAYDVDWTGTSSGEYDAVYLSGPGLSRTRIGYLNGYNATWTWSTFDVTAQATQGGNYTVEVDPSVAPGSSVWLVTARYASLTTGTTNGYITNLTVGADGKVNSTLTVDATGTYGITYYLVNSSNVVVSTYAESNNLTANTDFTNTGDQLPGWPVADGTYTLRAVLTDSSGSAIRDINTWTVVKSGGSVTTTPDGDSIPPTATISSTDNALKIGDTSTVTFTFSEDIQNFDLSDVTSAPNGTFGTLSSKVNNGNGTYSYSATFTPTANIEDATNQFVVGTGWSDIAGNAPSATTSSANYTVDTLRPTVTISSADNALKVGDTSTVTFTFSEDVQNFDLADVTAPNGTFGTLSSKVNNGNGTYSYSATFTPTANIEDATNQFVVGTGWSDIAGNAPSATTSSANYAIDTLRPTIAITSNKTIMHNDQSALITFTLSEESSSFVQSDVTVTGGKLSQWKRVNGSTYTAVFMPINNSNLNGSISVASNKLTDAAGNDNTDGSDTNNSLAITVAPTAVIRSTSPSVQPGSLNKAMITLTEGSNTFNLSSISSNVQLRDFKKISDELYEVQYVAPRSGTITLSVIAGSYTDLGGVASIANGDKLDSVTIDVSTVSSYGSTTPTSGGRGGATGIVVGTSSALPAVRTAAPVASTTRVPQPVSRSASTGVFTRR